MKRDYFSPRTLVSVIVSSGCVGDSCFFFLFSFRLWRTKTFQVSFPSPLGSLSHFMSHLILAFKGKPSMCGIGKIITKGTHADTKWHPFLELITSFLVDALIKTILPREDITQVANSCDFTDLRFALISVSAIYFNWGRILRKWRTCSWITH